jgi:hypothetical protein
VRVRAFFVGTLMVAAATFAPRTATSQDTLRVRAERVRADNPPVWGANVQLTKVFAIGEADGPPEYAFGRIGYFASFSDGRFYVYDEKDVQLRLYDPAGKFVAKVGGKGDGPGEYRRLMGMGILGDSLLVAWDVRNNRVSYFARDGKYVTSFVLERASQFNGPQAFGVDAKGLLYLRATAVRPTSPDGMRIENYVRYSASGTAIDSIRIPPAASAKGGCSPASTDGRRSNFPIETVFALYPAGGMIEGRTDQYAFTVPSSASGKAIVIEHRYDPVPLRAEERAEWDAIAQYLANLPRRPPAPNIMVPPPFEPRPLPRVKPAFRELIGDADGRVWVGVYTTAEKRVLSPRSGRDPASPQITWRERSVYDVFSRDGKFLGRVALPPQSALLGARGDRIWVQSVGENDEEMIIAYRIVTRGS